MNDTYRKHPKMQRADIGEFSRNELAILGTSCRVIRELAYALTRELTPQCKIAYVDADHASTSANGTAARDSALDHGASVELTNKMTFHRADSAQAFTPLQQKMLFNDQGLVLLNGNHFTGRSQVVIIDPAKPIEQSLHKLTDVRLIILRDRSMGVSGALMAHLSRLGCFPPVLVMDDKEAIIAAVGRYLKQRTPVLNGLVMAGGLSTRMQQDKGSLNYHGKTQREHVFDLLSQHCREVFVSCSQQQLDMLPEQLPRIADGFTGLGPLNGILSAFRHNPDAAWLVVACDLPYLSAQTLQYLVDHRDPYKSATAFLDEEGQYPQPLVTIWEPRSYPQVLQWLGLGYNCPRKILINTDTALLQAPAPGDLRNVNDPGAYSAAMQDLKNKA